MSKAFLRIATLAVGALIVQPALAQEHGTADEAVALVKKAVAHYKSAGREKACAAFADPNGGFQVKDLYVFVQDTAGVVQCHGKNPAFAGKDMSGLKDSDGKTFIAEMNQVVKGKGSGWVDYKWTNTQTKKIEPKSSYVETAGGDAYVGAGIYKP
ncbi:cache domain-containing protein [Magnetospirillum moscoviense]|uniref:Single Cache domain-containing protein n=1 Tax=Magnetospirillum moscoviense TaxID=1437059 RepID=A0A178MYW3_9PROT|nr:cache domain-containing protein [Magnetospirillum moscoviense]MBF0326368.1 cache domain-containing protein [Alphaproteobacteria bacterium]OAN60930.1 hypothetical protein A6A05_06890 [Magnetospirillum moscoviense]